MITACLVTIRLTTLYRHRLSLGSFHSFCLSSLISFHTYFLPARVATQRDFYLFKFQWERFQLARTLDMCLQLVALDTLNIWRIILSQRENLSLTEWTHPPPLDLIVYCGWQFSNVAKLIRLTTDFFFLTINCGLHAGCPWSAPDYGPNF
jgi:hypothetical protein